MLKAVEDISATKKRLRVEIPADAVDREITASVEKTRRSVTVPGFRTGKTPVGIIEKRFGKKIEADVLERIIPKFYMDAVKEADVMPVANPVLEEGPDLKRHNPASMTFTVEVMPKVEALDYNGLKIKELPATVVDADIDGLLKRLREERTTYSPSEGPAETNDLLVLDYSIKEDGTGAKDYIFKLGSGSLPDRFSEQLAGRKKGDNLTIEADFPEDYRDRKFAGRHLTFEVLIKDLKKAGLPQIDDEFGKDLGFGTLAEFRKHLGEEIEKAKKEEIAKIQKAIIMKKLLDSHDFAVPESLIENEVAALVYSEANRMQGMAPENGPDAEDIRQKAMPAAVQNVKAHLLLSMIGRKENVDVTEDDLKKNLLSTSAKLSVSPEEVMKYYISRDGSLNGLKNSIFEDKVLDLLLSRAVFEKGE